MAHAKCKGKRGQGVKTPQKFSAVCLLLKEVPHKIFQAQNAVTRMHLLMSMLFCPVFFILQGAMFAVSWLNMIQQK